jgi:hypothetical protein
MKRAHADETDSNESNRILLVFGFLEIWQNIVAYLPLYWMFQYMNLSKRTREVSQRVIEQIRGKRIYTRKDLQIVCQCCADLEELSAIDQFEGRCIDFPILKRLTHLQTIGYNLSSLYRICQSVHSVELMDMQYNIDLQKYKNILELTINIGSFKVYNESVWIPKTVQKITIKLEKNNSICCLYNLLDALRCDGIYNMPKIQEFHLYNKSGYCAHCIECYINMKMCTKYYLYDYKEYAEKFFLKYLIQTPTIEIHLIRYYHVEDIDDFSKYYHISKTVKYIYISGEITFKTWRILNRICKKNNIRFEYVEIKN